ncbi:MAG: PAS domain-containing protein [Planctomycetota bacterium]|nr:PAS domain-containing protein [Planctomycetota bacterium]
MAPPTIRPTGHERTFGKDEIIVSKTDLKGRITYANDVFLRVAQYTEAEVLGKPHNIIRHPAMPRCVFQLLWDTLAAGEEIFAYVINLTKHGDHYWVFAHVTPSYDEAGTKIGYHSNRRVPDRHALSKVKALYDSLLQIEKPFRTPREAIAASYPAVVDLLKSQNTTYDEFVFSLAGEDAAAEAMS